jgi:hypothetical protein
MNSVWATDWTFLVRFPKTTRDLFPPESVQNGSVAHQVRHLKHNKYLRDRTRSHLNSVGTTDVTEFVFKAL